MSSMECATELPLADSEQGDSQIEIASPASGAKSKALKGLVFGFAVTVTAGLALASWYVSARIVSADKTAPAPAPSLQRSYILIGPFTTREQMEQAQRKLQSAGHLAIETAH